MTDPFQVIEEALAQVRDLPDGQSAFTAEAALASLREEREGLWCCTMQDHQDAVGHLLKVEADCEEYLRRVLAWQARAEKAEAERDAALDRESGTSDAVRKLLAENQRLREALEEACRDLCESPEKYLGEGS